MGSLAGSSIIFCVLQSPTIACCLRRSMCKLHMAPNLFYCRPPMILARRAARSFSSTDRRSLYFRRTRLRAHRARLRAVALLAAANVSPGLHLRSNGLHVTPAFAKALCIYVSTSEKYCLARSSDPSGDRRPTLFVKTQIWKWLHFSWFPLYFRIITSERFSRILCPTTLRLS